MKLMHLKQAFHYGVRIAMLCIGVTAIEKIVVTPHALAEAPNATVAHNLDTATPLVVDTGQQISAQYRFHISGVEVAIAHFTAELTDDHYRSAAQIRSKGFVDRVLEARLQASAEGKIDAQRRLRSNTFSFRYHTDDEWQTTEMRYRNGRPRRVNITPPLVKDQIALDPFVQTGALDPVSGLLAGLISQTQADTICNRTIPIFDGRWRYDILLLPEDTGEVEGGAEAPDYPEPLTHCYGVYERIDGYPDDILETQRYAVFDIWFEQPKDGIAFAVRIAGKTSFGNIIGDLVR